MSGRDLRTFLSGHRSGTFHTGKNTSSLQHQYWTGTAPKIAPVNYDQLLSTVKQQKERSSEGLGRFRQISNKRKQAKQVSVLKKHHEVWQKEQDRLADLKSRTQAEINFWKADVLSIGFSELLSEITEFESELYEERHQFEEATVSPVWSLRTDLKTMVEHRSFPEADQTADSAHDEILHELEFVKEQQNKIQSLLQYEYEMVSSELEHFVKDLGSYGNSLVAKGVPYKDMVVKGVPADIDCLDCPDEKLHSDSLNEFVRLDEEYQTLLDKWRIANQHLLDLSHGGWSEREAERFSYLMEQYPPSLPNRRALYLDRALREFPDKRRGQIVDHETWHLSLKHYHSVERNLLTSWNTHKQELGSKVRSLFSELRKMTEAKEMVRTDMEKQREICHKLYQKVQTWREQKVKVQQAEAEKAARLQAFEEEQRRIEERKCREKRKQEKRQIQKYHSELSQRHQLELEQIERLEEAAKNERKKQAVVNLERIEYRQERLSERVSEMREARERALKEEREREKRLDLLRQQVQVDVSSDPLRVLQETKATHARLSSTQHPEFILQQPLYKLQSFPADKITSDPRVRLEAALREAGLHHTAYGRKILTRIPPPQKPRPDQQSSLFKD